jgi:hypothetical protein
MKRPWVVILIAFVLAGCRSSQPATNPFLRTTVPPPATGQGMMVMPGEAAPIGVAPPVVTGVPGAAPAVSPAQPAPLMTPPQQREGFQPPGGSYLYHQSSNERPRAGASSAAAERQLAAFPADDSKTSSGPDSLPATNGAVRQAGYVEPELAAPAATGTRLAFRSRDNTDDGRGDPPERLASMTAGLAAPGNAVRIVGESSTTPAKKVARTARKTSSPNPAVFRMTVGADGALPAPGAASADSSGPSTSKIAFVTPQPAARRASGAIGQSDFDSASTIRP